MNNGIASIPHYNPQHGIIQCDHICHKSDYPIDYNGIISLMTNVIRLDDTIHLIPIKLSPERTCLMTFSGIYLGSLPTKVRDWLIICIGSYCIIHNNFYFIFI